MKLLLLIITVCLTSYSQAADKQVLLTGSSTVAPIMLDIATAFEKQNPKSTIEVQTGGSTRGIIDIKRGLSQIGMISRDLKPTESFLKHKTIAIDGLGVIVHSSNPIKNLSKQQIKDIYVGKLKNWKQLGWVDKPITVVHKAEGRSTLELFLGYLEIKNSKIKPHLIIGDNEQGIKTIVGNPYSIGYVSIGAANYNIKNKAPLKLVDLDNVKASRANIINKTYPILRSLNLIYKGKLTESTQKLLAFSSGPEALKVLDKHYVISPQ